MWLNTIHCVASRARLTLKDTFLSFKEFKQVNDLMAFINLHKLLKQMFKNIALNIDEQIFLKVTKTRFVTHLLKETKTFLHITALANSH